MLQQLQCMLADVFYICDGINGLYSIGIVAIKKCS